MVALDLHRNGTNGTSNGNGNRVSSNGNGGSHPSANVMDGDDILKKSSLYIELRAEREEIDRLKWIASEKVGHDIGFNAALTTWVVHHRRGWRATRPAYNRIHETAGHIHETPEPDKEKKS